MNRQEIDQLLSERGALQRMIADTPEEEILDLRSLRARLDIVNRELERQPLDGRIPVKVRLTFRGRPVVGSHGIFAEFGVTATKAFTDAVALLAASFETSLAATGPIPNRIQNQLLIIRTAAGSFGFELEEHREGALPSEEDSTVSQALSKMQELLHGAASGSDDDLTDAASGQDPRAVAALRDFLKKLADNDAVCAISAGDKAFSFRDVGEVQRSLTRLGQENIHEESRRLRGVFQGVLPKRRTFEFKVADTDTVITGTIAPSIAEANTINRHLEEPTEILLIGTRVGQGRPRYVLKELPSWN